MIPAHGIGVNPTRIQAGRPRIRADRSNCGAGICVGKAGIPIRATKDTSRARVFRGFYFRVAGSAREPGLHFQVPFDHHLFQLEEELVGIVIDLYDKPDFLVLGGDRRRAVNLPRKPQE